MGSRYTLDQRIAQQVVRLEDLRAQAAKERRKADARRKIIVGATFLSLARVSDEDTARVVRRLDEHCTRVPDRIFLGLPTERPGEDGRAADALDVAAVADRLLAD